MGDTRELRLVIRPEFDDSALSKLGENLTGTVTNAIQGATTAASSNAVQSASAVASANNAGVSGTQDAQNAATQALIRAQDMYDQAKVMLEEARRALEASKGDVSRAGKLKGETSDLRNEANDAAGDAGDSANATERRNRALKDVIVKGGRMALDGVFKVAQASLSLVQNIYEKVKASSPLMQSIESLFNLAIQMFFMPIGNRLGEELIPATIGLLDAAIGIWDAFDNMTLGEAVTYALNEGLGIFADYFLNVGTQLSEQTGILGSVGEFMVEISYFVRDGFPKLLEDVLYIAMHVLENLEYFIKLYIAYQGAMMGSQLFESIPFIGSLVGGLAGAGAGYYLADRYVDIPSMGNVGYVPPSPEGSLRILAEAGEGEYVIPESKMNNLGTTIINNNFYGYNEMELMEKIDDTVNTAISRSRISGAF